MLLFFTPPYIIGELIVLTSLVFLFEYYFAKTANIEIDDRWLRLRITVGIILSY